MNSKILIESSLGSRGNVDLAWEIVRLLIDAGLAHPAEAVLDGLIKGGFYRRDRHDEAMTVALELLNEKGPTASELVAALLEGLDDNDGDIAWGCARTLLSSDFFDPETVLADEDEDDSDDFEQRIAFVTALLAEADRGADALPAVRRFLDSVSEHFPPPRLSKAVAERLVATQDAQAGYRAARWLLSFATPSQAAIDKIVIGGLGNPDVRDEALEMLESLIHEPNWRPHVLDALNRALWGSDPRAAWGSALFLLDQGSAPNPGVPRGLIFGGMVHHRRSEEAENRLETLLREDDWRGLVFDALSAQLSDEGDEASQTIASLLIRFGAPATTAVVASLFRHFHWWPMTPLAVIASAGRIPEVLGIAEELGCLTTTTPSP